MQRLRNDYKLLTTKCYQDYNVSNIKVEVAVPNLVERFNLRGTSLMMMPRAWRVAGSGVM